MSLLEEPVWWESENYKILSEILVSEITPSKTDKWYSIVNKTTNHVEFRIGQLSQAIFALRQAQDFWDNLMGKAK